MKKIFFIGVILIFVISSDCLWAQKYLKNTNITGQTYAGNGVTEIYIPPPKEYYRHLDKKGGAEITVLYTGATPAVINAVDFAATILESLLPDDTRITVSATYKAITTTGVLANSSVPGYMLGWVIDALKPLAYYPLPLAEKILGESLNGNQDADIILNINSSTNWYTGTDGKATTLQYDLVTVVLHELLHGLGFFDSMNTEGTVGYWGANSIPVIYDTFLENYSGKVLTDTLTFANPSTDLKRELTGGQVFFKGPVLSKYTGGTRARIYAPESFDAGSSISHLDEVTYQNDTIALMTPFVNRAESIHNPGKFTMSMLGDLGWINVSILHEAPKDTEEHLSEVTINATIKADTTYNRNKVGVVWSFDDFTSSSTKLMTSPSGNDAFTATIPVSTYNSELQYYIFTEDVFNRMFRSPSFYERFRYALYIGQDTVKPLISHTQLDYVLSKTDSIKFEASAYDNIGIDTVIVEYQIDNGPINKLGLKLKGDIEYAGGLKAKTLALSTGDSLRYRIFAYDKAASSNVKVLPSDGDYAVPIEKIYSAVAGYSTDFTNAKNDFLTSGFEITKPANWTKMGLHSIHPYTSPETSGDSLNFTALLRYPVKFDGNGMLFSYKEVVLVEPGEDGSVYGSSDFYDYVIVEGSKDYGKNWYPFIDGYDSRYNSSWETAYNSTITGMNSNYTGSESMLLLRTYFPKPSASFTPGDTLLIRFRLFSDPYANGWGWAVEDLHIGPIIDGISDDEIDPVTAYPNPGNGILTIRENDSKPSKFSVYNSAGLLVADGITKSSGETTIDLSSKPQGLYIIILFRDDGLKKIKYVLMK